MNNHTVDVVIVGGGPAGITAGLELSRSGNMKVALFEKEAVLGGMPRSCHIYFGLRDMKRLYRGRTYAEKLSQAIRKSSVDTHTETTVLDIFFGNDGEPHTLEVISPQGAFTYKTRFILLANGCFETSRQNRRIPGERASGVFTTGSLQQWVNLMSCKPGNRAVILGSELVALSCMMTLENAGLKIAGLIEEGPFLNTYAALAKAMSFRYRVPIWKNTSVVQILGRKRVEGVEIKSGGNTKTSRLDCDTVIVTGKFRPDSALIDNSAVELDTATLGPFVDNELETSVNNVFAAGNVLRSANTHDLCALEGKWAAQSILKRANGSGMREGQNVVFLRVEEPIRYVVPQRIVPGQTKAQSWWSPGYSIQVDHTLVKPLLEAWSGDQRIWQGSYRKLIGRYQYNLPVEKFELNRVDWAKGVTIKVR